MLEIFVDILDKFERVIFGGKYLGGKCSVGI